MADKSICSIPGCCKPVKIKLRGWCAPHYHRWVVHGDPLHGGPLAPPKGFARDFFEKVVRAYDGDECLTWPYQTLPKGYGLIRYKGSRQLVHRLLCAEVNGLPPTPRHEAAHSCGNGHLGCVTKRHLSWKTPSENAADKVVHGTDNRGEQNPQAKLTEEEVREIRALRGMRSQRKIADFYGINQTTVGQIQRGVRWAWLE